MTNKDKEMSKAEDEQGIDKDNVEQLSERSDEVVDEDGTDEQDQANPLPTQRKGRFWVFASVILFAALIFAIVNPPLSNADEDVAIVNGVKISKDKLYDLLVENAGEGGLENLITLELIDQEAKKAGVEITPEVVDAEIELIKTSFPSEEQFNNMLAQYGMTLEDLKKDLIPQIQIKKILAPDIEVTDEQIKTFYDENKQMFVTPEQVKVSHILLSSKEEAETVLTDLENGQDFAAVAKEKSLDEASKAQGGDLDFIVQGTRSQAFEEAAFALGIGEMSGVVQSDQGYHIIKVTDRKEKIEPTLEEKKEEIRQQLLSQEVSKLSPGWLEEVRAKSDIENLLFDAEEPLAS